MENQEKAILCIDDERIILDSIKSQLRSELGSGFSVEVAENANEGLEVIEEMIEEGVKVLVIVSDWLMPGMKGDEFLVQVHQKFPEIVKVMLTGQADESAVDRAFREANLYKVLSKPWEKAELVGTIRSGLEINNLAVS